MFRNVPSISTLARVLIMNGCWTLSNAFSASIEMIIWFLTFLLLMWCMTLIDLHMLNHACEPGMNPTWSLYDLFYMLLDKLIKFYFQGEIPDDHFWQQSGFKAYTNKTCCDIYCSLSFFFFSF